MVIYVYPHFVVVITLRIRNNTTHLTLTSPALERIR